MTDPAGPLSGIRVLDLTNVLSGPYCTYQLALLGAEVLKVEMPGRGDLARALGADPDLNERGVGSSFLAQNAGKRSVELDLKQDVDRDTFLHLAARADVVVENFRPGVMDRLGLGPDVLMGRNPQLVYCAISGFGQDGPMRERSAYDQIVQGLSGIMSVTGTPATAPVRAGFPVCDTFAGISAAFAICAALTGRAATGRGSVLDVSMLDTSVSALGWILSDYLVAGREPVPRGNDNATAAPSGTFATGGGALNIAANQQIEYARLCRLLGRDDLIADPRFATVELRKAHRGELTTELETALAARDAAVWEKELSAAGLSVGRVLTVAEVARMPQLAARNFFDTVALPDDPDRTVPVAGSVVHVNGAAMRPSGPAPRLGQHNTQPWSTP